MHLTSKLISYDVSRLTEGTGHVGAAPRHGRGRFEVRATAGDHFAWIRTRLSVERTMMAWLRTASR